ncbi:MAG: hypothetical protein J5842_04185 [Lachnospiraceae bacterium]|nr:hypothetical protein [Lachnospiraceae bacterium]
MAAAVVFLYLSALIKNDDVSGNFEKSADQLCEKRVFFYVDDGVEPSKIDRYADSILLNIAWNLKPDLTSLMWSSYYYTSTANENDNLYAAVYEKKEPNREYMRYWHGSAGIVRILHLIFNIKQIYILNGVVLLLLAALLGALLISNKMYADAAAMLFGLIGVSIWFVPFSLEYTWTFMIMLAAASLTVYFEKKGVQNILSYLFLLTGIMTAYLDFLSTETITLTVPLLLLCRIRLRYCSSAAAAKTPDTKKEALQELLKPGILPILWAIGYVGMWVSKWILTFFVTKENVMSYVSGHVAERLGGEVNDMPLPKFISAAALRNLSDLFPWCYKGTGIIAGIVLLIFMLYLGFVYCQKNINRKNILIYAAIAILPYLRYMVMHNHSYIHHFFTFRAQLVTIMAVWLILEEITSDTRNELQKIRKSKGRKKR